MWSSVDGTNWTQVTASATFPIRWGHSSVVFDNKIWVIGGRRTSSGAENRVNDMWSSSDGTNWVETTHTDFSARSAHSSVVFNNKIWVIGGHGNSGGGLPDVWSSP